MDLLIGRLWRTLPNRSFIADFRESAKEKAERGAGGRRDSDYPPESPRTYSGIFLFLYIGFERKAEMKLDQLESATSLVDLDLPGNRLEALKGERKGQYSILINDQWRICFEWPRGAPGPVNVEIIDYH